MVPMAVLRAAMACAAVMLVAMLVVADECAEGSCAQSESLDETPLLQVKSKLPKLATPRGRGYGAGSSDTSGDDDDDDDDKDKNKGGNKHKAMYLGNSDFSKGTYRIRRSGYYKLKSDVVFDPISGDMSWCKIPSDSEEYPQLLGYFLGFHAAVTVEADNVELDCRGHEIRMSEAFHKCQRFFSIIELCDRPFKAGQGPPPFANNLTTVGEPTCAHNVTIRNCRLGLSSHHGIHGNDNTGVKLEGLSISGFEVAGVSLNGAERVSMERLYIGGSLKHTFLAELSQAMLMDHIANTLMVADRELSILMKATSVKLRGVVYSVAQVMLKLRIALQQFIKGSDGPLLSVCGDGHALPDGSAIYGILLHRSGVAIGDFGAFCPDDDDETGVDAKRVHDIVLKDISIHDLALKVDQVAMTVIDGKSVAGLAGDLLKITNCWNADGCYEYVGNPLADAQIAMGKFRAACTEQGMEANKLSFYFGSSYIPEVVADWAEGGKSCETTKSFAHTIIDGKLSCQGDAMNHHNKGVVALRLGFQADISVTNVVIKNLVNEGTLNAAPYCKAEGYKGTDVRGASLAHMSDMKKLCIETDNFTSTNMTNVFPVTGFLQMRADDATA